LVGNEGADELVFGVGEDEITDYNEEEEEEDKKSDDCENF